MRLTISHKGERKRLEVDNDCENVSTVKRLVVSLGFSGLENFEISLNGKNTLEESKSLKECEVVSGDVLYIIQKYKESQSENTFESLFPRNSADSKKIENTVGNSKTIENDTKENKSDLLSGVNKFKFMKENHMEVRGCKELSQENSFVHKEEKQELLNNAQFPIEIQQSFLQLQPYLELSLESQISVLPLSKKFIILLNAVFIKDDDSTTQGFSIQSTSENEILFCEHSSLPGLLFEFVFQPMFHTISINGILRNSNNQAVSMSTAHMDREISFKGNEVEWLEAISKIRRELIIPLIQDAREHFSMPLIASLSTLPFVVQENILSFLKAEDLVRLSETSHEWWSIVTEMDSVWARLMEKDFKIDAEVKQGESCFEIYVKNYYEKKEKERALKREKDRIEEWQKEFEERQRNSFLESVIFNRRSHGPFGPRLYFHGDPFF